MGSMTTPDYELRTLSNGIRIAHKQVTTTKIAHIAFVLNVGSRDERPEELGIAHFWEHMAFKGTSKHSAFHICNTLERVGGELNAYTTKEKICFYASVLAPHFKKAATLLNEILFESTFPEKEIEKERNVILEEMSMYQDSPDDAISDEFDAVVYEHHTLGNNILGTTESIKAIDKAAFKRFIDDHLNTEELVIATVGPISFKDVLKVLEPLLDPVTKSTPKFERIPYLSYKPQQIERIKPITQAHELMGCPALPFAHPDRVALVMLTNMLGGPAMNSKLNLAVRERHGLTYAIEANYTPYSDTGLWAIYFGTEARQIERVRSLINKELKVLREKPLTDSQLKQVKEQLKGQLAMSEEGNLNLCLALGKTLLDVGKMDSIQELFSQIDAVTSIQLADLANQFMNPATWTTLTYIPDPDAD